MVASSSHDGEASTKPALDDTQSAVDIAPQGGILIDVQHQTGSSKFGRKFRVDSNALKATSKYFERLLQIGRFGEGAQIEEQHNTLRKLYKGLEEVPSAKLPVVQIVDIGRLPTVKSIEALFTDFLYILHGKDINGSPPVANLANLAIVADRFDAVDTVRLYVQRKKILKAIDGKTTPKQDASLSEEKMRQRLLVGLMLHYASWIEKYSARLISKGWVAREVDPSDALWWDLPGRVEDELALRRDSVLETIQSLQNHFLSLFSSRDRQCRLGYDSSPECDSFQFGEMVRFFIRAGTLRLQGTLIDADEPTQIYDGDIFQLIERLKQIPEYQVDRNHSHCGIRTRLVPLLDLIVTALQHIGLCGECWIEDRARHAWIQAKRPLVWRNQYLASKTEGHERRHELARSFLMSTERIWN